MESLTSDAILFPFIKKKKEERNVKENKEQENRGPRVISVLVLQSPRQLLASPPSSSS